MPAGWTRSGATTWSRLQGLPRRVAVLPPRLDAVLDAAGNVVDAQAVPVPDLDDQVLRDWAAY